MHSEDILSAVYVTMRGIRTAALHVVIVVCLGAVIVATPIPLNIAAFVAWMILVASWTIGRVQATSGWAGLSVVALQTVAMAVFAVSAAYAPIKTVDRKRAETIVLDDAALTVGQLKDPFTHVSPLYYSMYEPSDQDGLVVRFPARRLTVSEFIRAIEAQTPLRHRFGSCGNGWTVLYGKDCSFGLSFNRRDD